MTWTPPSKFVVIITFVFMSLGIFIFLDQHMTFWGDSILPTTTALIINYWDLIMLILFFLTWFLFFLGVKLKGF